VKANDSEVAALRGHGAATVFEASGGRASWVRGLRAVWSPVALAGPAYPVAADPADNLALHRALAVCPVSVVLVAATQASVETAIWGELLTVAAIARGVLGLVTDGAVRDVASIRRLGFPVFAAQTTPVGSAKLTPGQLAVPVDLAGVKVVPDDWVVADEDGVVVVAAGELKEILAAADDRRRTEADLVHRIRGGELTIDLLGLRERATDEGGVLGGNGVDTADGE
jgi:4-hydroxy-4-methyl-2-oxoglutarate aldolase